MNTAKVGFFVKLAGMGGIAAGVVMSLHHIPVAVALIGGGVAYFVGRKLGGASVLL